MVTVGRSALQDTASPSRDLPPSTGDQAPFCMGVTAEGVFYSFQAQAGRPAVLILADVLTGPSPTSLAAAFSRRFDEFAALGADVVLLANANPMRVHEYAASHPTRVRIVAGVEAFFRQCGFADGARPLILLLDRNTRLAGRFEPADEAAAVAAALAGIAALPIEEPRDVLLPAPVVMIPNLLERDLCRDLIEAFERGGSFDSGFATLDPAGNPLYKVDHAKKKRRDHFVDPENPIHRRLADLLMRRCAPEIKKAFQVDIAHMDRILVARYDNDGSVFRRHRDNVAANVAFRQFAISLNLNAGYEGGYLLFPECNAHRYRPATGAGLVFSASLLHEATPVTSGSRYVLLTFFHDAAAEARRLAYAAHATKDAADTATVPAKRED